MKSFSVFFLALTALSPSLAGADDLTSADRSQIAADVAKLEKFLPSAKNGRKYEGKTPEGQACQVIVEMMGDDYRLILDHPATNWQYDPLAFDYGVNVLDTNFLGVKAYGISTYFKATADSIHAQTGVPSGNGARTVEIKLTRHANSVTVKMQAARSLLLTFAKWYACTVNL